MRINKLADKVRFGILSEGRGSGWAIVIVFVALGIIVGLALTATSP